MPPESASVPVVQVNEFQQRAIRHNAGPLRIIAGAGTGKTQTLANSVAHLVRENLARPEQILAITFTRKAAAELRERMAAAISTVDGASGDVDVDTYNAFGGRVVQQHGYRIGLSPDLTMMTEASAWILLWRIVDEIQFTTMDWTSPRGSGYGSSGPLSRILAVASRLADERRDLDDLRAHVEEVGLLDDPDLDDILRTLERYEARKRQLGALDFGDQIRLACDLLERDDVRDFYAQTYRYILVDEFQDTNYGQRAMIRALGSSVDGNIRVVGDPNQAIYGFRGAAPDNLEGFQEDFPEAETIPLSLNYRSTERILNVANALWDADPGEFRGNLEPGTDRLGTKAILAGCTDLYSEAAYIASEIAKLNSSGTTYDKIAILVRKNAPKLRLYAMLTDLGVPIELTGGRSLFDQPEVQLLHSALRVIAGDDDDIPLAHVLSSDRWGLDEASLYQIALQRDRRERLILGCRRIAANPVTPAAEMLRDCMNSIESLTEFAYVAPLTQVVDRTARELLGALEGGAATNVAEFKSLVREFVENQDQPPGLRELLVYLDLLLSANPDQEAAPEREPGESATVKMMTMHSAKGLQWPVVFIATANSSDQVNKQKLARDAIPPELVREGSERPERKDYPAGMLGRGAYLEAVEAWRESQRDREDRRLLYVALTRAREHLYITWSAQDPTRKGSATVSPMIEELVEWCECIEPATVSPPDPDKTIAAFARMAIPLVSAHLSDVSSDASSWTVPMALIAEPWTSIGARTDALPFAFGAFAERKAQLDADIALIDRVEENRQKALMQLASASPEMLTYTQIDQFKHCPHRWFLRYRVGLPGIPEREAANYGTNVHEVLQREAEARLAGGEGGVPPAQRPSLPESAVETNADGIRFADPIDAYLQSVDALSEPLLVEAAFSFMLGDIPISGVIDRVHRRPDGLIEVVDYKTDRRLRSRQEVIDGMQLQLYLIAMRRVFTDIQPSPTAAAMFFLRHETRVEIQFREQDLADAEWQIVSIAQQIRNVTPDAHKASPETCRFCEYRLTCRFSQTTAGSSPITIT